MKQLPGNTHLAYTIYHETEWWPKLPANTRPNDGLGCVQVAASAKGRGGGVRWEFAIVLHHLLGGGHGDTPEIRMMEDSWVALEEIPEFFASLAGGRISSLEEITEILGALGAVDETERHAIA